MTDHNNRAPGLPLARRLHNLLRVLPEGPERDAALPAYEARAVRAGSVQLTPGLSAGVILFEDESLLLSFTAADHSGEVFSYDNLQEMMATDDFPNKKVVMLEIFGSLAARVYPELQEPSFPPPTRVQ